MGRETLCTEVPDYIRYITCGGREANGHSSVAKHVECSNLNP